MNKFTTNKFNAVSNFKILVITNTSADHFVLNQHSKCIEINYPLL